MGSISAQAGHLHHLPILYLASLTRAFFSLFDKPHGFIMEYWIFQHNQSCRNALGITLYLCATYF